MTNHLIQPVVCPLCQSALQEVEATTFDTIIPGYHIRGRALPTKKRETTIIACTGCEFAVDMKTTNGSDKSSAQLLADVGRLVGDA
jgi:hypothetical protein